MSRFARTHAARILGLGLTTSALAAPLCLGCIPELDPASLIDRTRVVAARVSPVDAPDVAWPAPGEDAVIDWVVVQRGPTVPLAAMFFTCTPLPGTSGAPACITDTLRPLAPNPPSTAPLRTALTIPSLASLGGGTNLLVTGALCVGGGVPVYEAGAQLPSCDDGTTAETLFLSVPLATGEIPRNRHPHADGPWTLAGAPWEPATDELPEDCAAEAGTPSLPRIAAGSSELTFTVTARGEDREAYAATEGDPPRPVTRTEDLQINHFASAGELARGVSAFDETSDPATPIDIGWTPPAAEDVPPGGLLVRFATVFRDGRSGVDAAYRALCVTR